MAVFRFDKEVGVPQEYKIGGARRFTGLFDVIALAASAGGLAALREILGALPADLPAALVIVQHLDPKHPSLLASILGRRTFLRVKQAEASDVLAPGQVFIAPPNSHLLVQPDHSLVLSQSEPVHLARPSADVLFESVAASFQARAIAVVLTGSGHDGAVGVRAIKKMGGIVIVQDKESAEFAGMPNAALETGGVDLILPLKQIAPRLVSLVLGEDDILKQRTQA